VEKAALRERQCGSKTRLQALKRMQARKI